MKNDNEERLIEALVTIGTLIFFGFLSMYVMRGCSDKHSISRNLASTAAMGTAPSTALKDADANNKRLEVDKDANLSLDNRKNFDVNTTASTANIANGALISQSDSNISDDENVKEDKEAMSNSKTSDTNNKKEEEKRSDSNISDDKNAKEDKEAMPNSKTSDNTKKDNKISDKTEAEEEAGIIADIENERLSPKPYILKGIHFKSGSAVLTAKSKRQLDAIGKALKLHKNVIITLRGHTDMMGSSKQNELLSLKRAATVGYALVERGANVDNIWTVGMGELEPIVTSGSAKEMAKNRRVDIAVTK